MDEGKSVSLASSLSLSHRPPRAFFFALSSPPYDTKRPLRRRELSKCPQLKLEDGEYTNLVAF